MLGVFPLWVWVSFLIAVLVSRPLEGRLWRQGRLSNRALAVLLVARFPVVIAIAALGFHSNPTVGLLLVALSAIPGVVMYRYVRDMVEEQAREQARARDRAAAGHV